MKSKKLHKRDKIIGLQRNKTIVIRSWDRLLKCVGEILTMPNTFGESRWLLSNLSDLEFEKLCQIDNSDIDDICSKLDFFRNKRVLTALDYALMTKVIREAIKDEICAN